MPNSSNHNQGPIPWEEWIPVLREGLESGTTFSFTAHGRSMQPYLRGGLDKVTLSPIQGPLKKNEIYLFRAGDRYYLHRLITLRKDGCFDFQGDNRIGKEVAIPREQVYAVLTGIERNGVSRSPSSGLHRIYCVILPLIRFANRILIHIKRRTERT